MDDRDEPTTTPSSTIRHADTLVPSAAAIEAVQSAQADARSERHEPAPSSSLYPEPTRGALVDPTMNTLQATPAPVLAAKPVHGRVLSLHFYTVATIVFSILSIIVILHSRGPSQGGLLSNNLRLLGYATALVPLLCAPAFLFAKRAGLVEKLLTVLLINYGIISLATYILLIVNFGTAILSSLPLIPILETCFIYWTRHVRGEVIDLPDGTKI